MNTENHRFDFCVIGGGLSGLCAAIAAARQGIKTALIHDRPVFGGNASSEIRMWICGAKDNKETGLMEEIHLDNLYYNPYCNYSIWDGVLYSKAKYQDNLEIFLNCSCADAEMEDNHIKAVKCWQLTTYTWHRIEADFYADCSGDSVLAPLTGAEFRTGREARAEFDEDIEPEEADSCTMGMSLLIQPREHKTARTFRKFPWANTYPTSDSINNRFFDKFNSPYQNFWWVELGGRRNTIKETELIRDDLLKLTFGIWDHVKNQVPCESKNWDLDWMGFLPGKRESLRYVGDHILTQNDVRAEGKFDDLVAYGGWPMDDHHPDGFEYPDKPTIFHPAPNPFGIPYRSLYSKNIENLFFAGRNISTTHAAMSSTRVMATCSIIGQAVGTAAALAHKKSTSPRGVYQKHIKELQQTLMHNDCYLPWNTREVSALTKEAAVKTSQGNGEVLRNGLGRKIGDNNNSWSCKKNGFVEYSFNVTKDISELRLVFDSDLLNRKRNMLCNYPLDSEERQPPSTLVKSFRVEIKNGDNWQKIHEEKENFQRLQFIPVNMKADAVRIIPEETWGTDCCNLFEFDVL